MTERFAAALSAGEDTSRVRYGYCSGIVAEEGNVCVTREAL